MRKVWMLAALGAAMVCAVTQSPAQETKKTGPTKAELTEALNDFSLSVFRDTEQRNGTENCAWYPAVSIPTVTLAGSGASGPALTQLQTLRFTGVGKEAEVAELLKFGGKEVTYKSASALLVKRGTTVEPDFIALGKKTFGTRVFLIPEKEAAAIFNNWIVKPLGDDFKDFFQQKTFDDDPPMIIVGAAYIEGKWKEKFYSNKDTKGEFKLPDGKSVELKYMSSTGKFDKTETKSGIIVRMPAEGGATALLVMPKDKQSLKDALAEVKAKDIPTLVKEGKKGDKTVPVKVKVPPIKLKTGIDLVPAMKSLKVTRMFEAAPKKGDLSFARMCPENDIYVTGYRQAATFDMDHNGFRGGAAEEMTFGSRGIDLDGTVTFDRPYAVLVVNDKGVIAVTALVRNPTVAK